jgi:hypothetical protein
MSNLVEEKDLDEFFQASSLNEQKERFKKISSGLKGMILLVKCTFKHNAINSCDYAGHALRGSVCCQLQVDGVKSIWLTLKQLMETLANSF